MKHTFLYEPVNMVGGWLFLGILLSSGWVLQYCFYFYAGFKVGFGYGCANCLQIGTFLDHLIIHVLLIFLFFINFLVLWLFLLFLIIFLLRKNRQILKFGQIWGSFANQIVHIKRGYLTKYEGEVLGGFMIGQKHFASVHLKRKDRAITIFSLFIYSTLLCLYVTP